jgi:hypothetical protein
MTLQEGSASAEEDSGGAVGIQPHWGNAKKRSHRQIPHPIQDRQAKQRWKKIQTARRGNRLLDRIQSFLNRMRLSWRGGDVLQGKFRGYGDVQDREMSFEKSSKLGMAAC